MSAETVVAPKDHEGVGAALRSAYSHGANTIPREIARLLDQLN